MNDQQERILELARADLAVTEHNTAIKYKWGTDYGKDLLVDLNQLAHARGTGALHRDGFQRAFVEIKRLRADLATHVEATAETENRIINAEFVAQEMRTAIEMAIEAMERGSSTAPVVECLRAALTSADHGADSK